MEVIFVVTYLLITNPTMTQNKNVFCQAEVECIRLKQLPEEIHKNRFKQSHINQDKTIVLFWLVMIKIERRIQISFMVHTECFLEDSQYREHLVILRPSVKNLVVIQMLLLLHQISKNIISMITWISFCLDVSNSIT